MLKKNLFIIFKILCLIVVLIGLLGCRKEEEDIAVFVDSSIENISSYPSVSVLTSPDLEEKKETEKSLLETNYPIAATIYQFLSNVMFLNDNVCAGILGNMMAETGGQTLDIKWDIGTDYYGICQWSTYYNPDIVGTDLEGQLRYLYKTIYGEFAIFGYKYAEDFDYVDFQMMDDCQTAALAFAQVYERCYHEYYEVRQQNAVVALEFIKSLNAQSGS